MNTARISTLAELMAVANKRGAVTVPSSTGFKKPKPAAFVIGMPGNVLYHLMLSGMYVWSKDKK